MALKLHTTTLHGWSLNLSIINHFFIILIIIEVYTVFRKKVVYFVFDVTSQLQARFSYNFQ